MSVQQESVYRNWKDCWTEIDDFLYAILSFYSSDDNYTNTQQKIPETKTTTTRILLQWVKRVILVSVERKFDNSVESDPNCALFSQRFEF